MFFISEQLSENDDNADDDDDDDVESRSRRDLSGIPLFLHSDLK